MNFAAARILLAAALGALLLRAPAAAPLVPGAARSLQPAPARPLEVMTFNLRYASDARPHSWAERRPVAAALIERAKPDLIGTQEGLFAQLEDLQADLPGYDAIGLGREGGSHGEFMAVFYLKERLRPLEYDHFWLSETPRLAGSRGFGAALPRMVTWVRFRDRGNEREFLFVNTHFDHRSEEARRRSADMVHEFVSGQPAGLPVILAGDFNAEAPGSAAYERLAEGMLDTFVKADAASGSGTFHGFTGEDDGRRIDWILLRGPLRATACRIDRFAAGGQYPSDHFPVAATLSFLTE